MLYVAPIVEGHGEYEAVPKLLYRIANDGSSPAAIRVNPPIRVRASQFLNNPDQFRRYVAMAGTKVAQETDGFVLILLDCEDGCPAQIGPDILSKARAVRGDVEYFVALAHREYETWFVASSRSLRGLRGIPETIEPPLNPEAIRGAKEWLGRNMTESYDPVIHQSEFTQVFDLSSARAIPSFDRLYRHVRAHLT